MCSGRGLFVLLFKFRHLVPCTCEGHFWCPIAAITQHLALPNFSIPGHQDRNSTTPVDKAVARDRAGQGAPKPALALAAQWNPSAWTCVCKLASSAPPGNKFF